MLQIHITFFSGNNHQHNYLNNLFCCLVFECNFDNGTCLRDQTPEVYTTNWTLTDKALPLNNTENDIQDGKTYNQTDETQEAFSQRGIYCAVVVFTPHIPVFGLAELI